MADDSYIGRPEEDDDQKYASPRGGDSVKVNIPAVRCTGSFTPVLIGGRWDAVRVMQVDLTGMTRDQRELLQFYKTKCGSFACSFVLTGPLANSEWVRAESMDQQQKNDDTAKWLD